MFDSPNTPSFTVEGQTFRRTAILSEGFQNPNNVHSGFGRLHIKSRHIGTRATGDAFRRPDGTLISERSVMNYIDEALEHGRLYDSGVPNTLTGTPSYTKSTITYQTSNVKEVVKMSDDNFKSKQEFKIMNIRKDGLVETSFNVNIGDVNFCAQTDFFQERLPELKTDRAKGEISILGDYKQGSIKKISDSYNIECFYDIENKLYQLSYIDGFVLKKKSNVVFLRSKFDIVIDPVSKDDIDKFQEGDFIRIEEPSLWIHNIEPL